MKWTVSACWLSQKSWHMTEWGRVMLSHIGYCNDSLLIHLYWDRYQCRFFYKLEYFILSLSSMDLAINNMCVCVRACVRVCVLVLVLLSHFLPFKIHLTNISPILIKMVDFKNLATSFATRASRKVSTCPTGQVGKKVIVIPWYIWLSAKRCAWKQDKEGKK